MTVTPPRLFLARLAPVVLLTAAAAAYIFSIDGADRFAIRNFLPMLGVILLSSAALWLGDGKWSGAGWRWPLGVVGFAIPSIGLSLYLHYAYSVDLNDLFSGSEKPEEVFRFLPLYTTVSGFLGFAIGWIIGSRV